MSQINVFFGRYGEVIEMPCPQCETTVEVEYLRQSLAELLTGVHKCVDCECEFTVGTVLLDPRRLTLDEAVRELAEVETNTLRTEDKSLLCPEGKDVSQNIFDPAIRNIELIIELMDIVGVADCEELTDKVGELVRIAKQPIARDEP